jgi:ABC-type cobalamin/Fe3+-siderophores transport system ATPase subunit
MDCIIGLNGTGKTTTIRALLGMIRPSAGSVQVLGQAVGPSGGGARRLSRIDHQGKLGHRPLPDQAALHGVLNRILYLGLTLVSLNRTEHANQSIDKDDHARI